jgi:uridylate kinase
MDYTAVSLCMENKLPLVVFNLFDEGSLSRILSGEPVGTKIL